MGKPNTQSPILFMKDNLENRLNLRDTLDRMYLTNMLGIQYLQIRLHNDDNEAV